MKTLPRRGGPVVHPASPMACTRPGVDANTFFPVGTSGPALLQIAQAKAICRSCEVLEPCRTEALTRPELHRHGVVGGMSEDERAAIVRRAPRRKETGQ